MTLDQEIGITGVIATTVIGGLAWLVKPEWMHSLFKRVFRRPIKWVNLIFPNGKQKIDDQLVTESESGLRVKATMELRSADKREILLVINAVNLGSKIAFIKKVAVIIPSSTSTPVENPSIQFTPDTTELVAKQSPVVIEIKPDGGLYSWEIKLVQNLQYGIEEIEGDKCGKGYVELTSDEKVEFRYFTLPDSAWNLLTAPIAPVFDGKTAHRCSNCDFIFLTRVGETSITCPRCKHIDILKPAQRQNGSVKSGYLNEIECQGNVAPRNKRIDARGG